VIVRSAPLPSAGTTTWSPKGSSADGEQTIPFAAKRAPAGDGALRDPT
jgi:hypothetical protein